MKKLISLVLALAMIMMVGAAFAGSIVIQAADPNDGTGVATYTVYKLFDVTKATDDQGNVTGYSYTIGAGDLKNTLAGVKMGANNTGDAAFTFTASAGNADLFVVTANWEASAETTSKNVAANIKAALETANINATATYNTAGTKSVDDGYYLITSSLGTNLGMATTDIAFTVVEKNDWPGVEKEVDKATAELGNETITYTVEVAIPANVASHDIAVIDTATNGLTFDTSANAITVTKKNDGAAVTTLSWSDTTTSSTIGSADATVYTATIPAATVVANAGETLVLTYHATLNENAVVNVPEKNKVKITYDNFTSVETEPVETKHLGFQLEKVDATDTTNKLAGVKFTLTNADGKYYTEPSDANNIDEDRFQDAKATITTKSDGTYDFTGLHAGVYTLTEDETLNGYKLLSESITITVADNNTISYTYNGETSTGVVKITVTNAKGVELPSTGGIGTTIFYIVGGMLLVGAAIVLVARRKASEN